MIYKVELSFDCEFYLPKIALTYMGNFTERDSDKVVHMFHMFSNGKKTPLNIYENEHNTFIIKDHGITTYKVYKCPVKNKTFFIILNHKEN